MFQLPCLKPLSDEEYRSFVAKHDRDFKIAIMIYAIVGVSFATLSMILFIFIEKPRSIAGPKPQEIDACSCSPSQGIDPLDLATGIAIGQTLSPIAK